MYSETRFLNPHPNPETGFLEKLLPLIRKINSETRFLNPHPKLETGFLRQPWHLIREIDSETRFLCLYRSQPFKRWATWGRRSLRIALAWIWRTRSQERLNRWLTSSRVWVSPLISP
jgi:hypothetical protein